ncbi:MAG: indolepyruvate ferredoxin oxidoreductase subunit alpha [Thermoplasmata archaeon]|nr:indolepyruvate ferredoxin oxidoreductase subunit alpha [Thermoplasmata archaeon]
MKYENILLDESGRREFLLGNEAIVRGAIEAGVDFASTYPGTPSSEIGNVLFYIAKKAGMYFEFSTNEKVALEVSAAAAASGLRSMVFFKHVGLNVAADAFMSTAYVGTNGGFVIISADDPSMHSSQNEQDNRYYALISGMPMVEPSDAQEMKDFLKEAFEISERHKLPVLFRTTTRVNHVRGIVEYGEIKRKNREGYFKKNPSKYVILPSSARRMHRELLEKLKKVEEEVNSSPLNRIEGESSEIGVITSGVAYNYIHDAVKELGLKVKILKLGFTHPFPRKLVKDFIEGVKKVIIVEELEPYLEKETRLVAQINGIDVDIYGKLNGYFPRVYEYNPDVVKEALEKILDIKIERNAYFSAPIELPSRPPVLCPGCPHRATYYAAMMALKQLKIKDAIITTDIGCYTLGIQKPYEMADYLLCMGSSIGTAVGFSKATKQKVIGFVGDSTFFHASIPGLIDAYHNRANVVYVVLDNRTTAMTGHQPHPGLPVNGMGEKSPYVDIEKLVRGIGIDFVKTVDPYNVKETIKVFKEAIQHEGIAVIISQRECALLWDARRRKQGEWWIYQINQDKCTQCSLCSDWLACAAIFKRTDKDGKVRIYINDALCDGCGVCASICPFNAIEKKVIK